MEWIREANKSGLLNLLWVPHYHRSKINTTCIWKLLTLVHNGCLWIGMPIPITHILIHRITHLPHEGLNPAKEFGRKTSERELAEQMKKKIELIKKPHGYSITSINNPAVKIATKILARKVMRKCRANEVPAPVVTIVANCAEGYTYNWADYITKEFLEDVLDA